jgi:cytochrome c-type biogenesis protein
VNPSQLSFLVAVAAGLLSFVSPCVLPLVPAYVGQLTAVAVSSPRQRPSRWLALGHAAAFVAGFGGVFFVLGMTATYAAGGLVDLLPVLRQVGGVILIILGLHLAGFLHLRLLDRVWRPLEERRLRESWATALPRATTSPREDGPAPAGGGSSLASASRSPGWWASLALGAIFALGWTPCIGIILGSILTMAATSTTRLQGAILLTGYILGLGVPFLAVGALYDRAPALLRPLVRHGRAVSLVGGALVVAVGIAILFDWLALVPQFIPVNTAV